MDERKIVEALAAEIELATAAGDQDRARKLADLQGRVGARTKSDSAADSGTDPLAIPLARPGQLAPVARRISAEALSAELAAERGDWDTVHATYERLALLFAEYRLRYMQWLAQSAPASDLDSSPFSCQS